MAASKTTQHDYSHHREPAYDPNDVEDAAYILEHDKEFDPDTVLHAREVRNLFTSPDYSGELIAPALEVVGWGSDLDTDRADELARERQDEEAGDEYERQMGWAA